MNKLLLLNGIVLVVSLSEGLIQPWNPPLAPWVVTIGLLYWLSLRQPVEWTPWFWLTAGLGMDILSAHALGVNSLYLFLAGWLVSIKRSDGGFDFDLMTQKSRAAGGLLLLLVFGWPWYLLIGWGNVLQWMVAAGNGFMYVLLGVIMIGLTSWLRHRGNGVSI